MKQFKRTVETALYRESSLWDLGEDLLSECKVLDRGQVAPNELVKAAKAIEEAGGTTYKPNTLSAFRSTAAAYSRGQRVSGVAFRQHTIAIQINDQIGTPSQALKSAKKAARKEGVFLSEEFVRAHVKAMNEAFEAKKAEELKAKKESESESEPEPESDPDAKTQAEIDADEEERKLQAQLDELRVKAIRHQTEATGSSFKAVSASAAFSLAAMETQATITQIEEEHPDSKSVPPLNVQDLVGQVIDSWLKVQHELEARQSIASGNTAGEGVSV